MMPAAEPTIEKARAAQRGRSILSGVARFVNKSESDCKPSRLPCDAKRIVQIDASLMFRMASRKATSNCRPENHHSSKIRL
jgi:hypothetical protein